jgi:hypothetical protein
MSLQTILAGKADLIEGHFWLEQILNTAKSTMYQGQRGSVEVKALCYKPEGRGFDSRWGEFFKFT